MSEEKKRKKKEPSKRYKIPKALMTFRISEEIRCSLEVLQEMTGATMTEVLESCIRIGKKSVAKARGLDYNQVLFNIISKRKILQSKRQNPENPEPENKEPENKEEEIKLARTRWIND